jgi:nucleoid-associated protein YgaU
LPEVETVVLNEDGGAVLAGRGAEGATLSIRLDGTEIAAAVVDRQGRFASLFDIPAFDQPRVLTLVQTAPDGSEQMSGASIIVAPFATVPVPDQAPAPEDAAQQLAAAEPSPEASPTPAPAEPEAPEPVAEAPATPQPDAAPEVVAEAPAEPQPTAAPEAVAEAPAAPQPAAAPDAVAEAPAAAAPQPEAVAEAPATPQPNAAPDAAAEAPAAAAPKPEAVAEAPATPQPDAAPEAVAEAPAAAAPQPEAVAEAPETPQPTAAPAAVAEAPTAPQPDPAPDTVAAPVSENTQIASAQPSVQEPAATQDQAAETPTNLLVGAEGVQVLRPALPGSLSIDAVTYTQAGGVEVSGRAPLAGTVQLYLDNAAKLATLSDEAGHWRATMEDVAPGLYTLRADAVDPAGKVVARAETPFLREAPEQLANLFPAAGQGGGAGPSDSTAETATNTGGAAGTANPPQSGQPATVPSVAVPITARIVTVQPGFTLWGIAKQSYGEGVQYVKVFEANRAQIRNPDLIYPGQVFSVPLAPPRD